MCDDSCDHAHEVEDQGHSRQENKDLADISRYLEDDGLNGNAIKLPAFITDAKISTRVKRLEREKQLSSIKVDKSHVDLLMKELELTKLAAEKLLRRSNGNVQDAFQEFIKI